MQAIKVNVNGDVRDAMVEPDESLLHFVRERLQLTGTKEGCSTGYCGACTVLVDGEPVNACLFFAVDADRRHVTTVEDLSGSDGTLATLQRCFIEAAALQCGFCTPGMLLAAAALLERTPSPSEDDVRAALSGNICRCTGYQPIIKAVQSAAQALRREGASAPPRTPQRVQARA